MAKVSPLYSRQKFDWTKRFFCLMNAIGVEVLDLTEENSSNAGVSSTYRGTRVSISARVLRGHIETTVRVYNNKDHWCYMVRSNKERELHSEGKQVELNFREVYKRLERLIYRNFNNRLATDIMSRGDDNYNWSKEND